MAKPRSKQLRQVFVAYSYKTYDKADYRRVFKDLERAYRVSFVFADEKITNMHIMQKIISYIRGSDFSIFDISGWNPNVTLELGWAMATSDNWYIALNPKETDLKEVPSDLRGLDRIQYESFTDLGGRIGALIEQRYPKRKSESLDQYVEGRRRDLLRTIRKSPGFTISEIADLLGVEIGMAKFLVQPLVGRSLRTSGVKKGTRYFPMRPGPIPRPKAKAS
jgi:hypothetical protein